jgi:TolA-binding protein
VEQAFVVADKYIKNNPESQLSQELLLRRGDFYFGLNQFQEAIYAYQNYLRTYPGSLMAPKAQYWIGLSQVNLNQTTEAMASFEKLVRQYPDSEVVPDALFQLGILCRNENKFDQSVAYFQKIMDSQNRRSQEPAFLSEVHYQQGLTYLRQNSTNQAESAFKKSIQREPSSFSSYQARIELARIYSADKEVEQAKNYLEQVIQDRNDELAAQAQKVLGDVFYDSGNYQEALTNFLRVKYVYQAYPTWVANALFSAGMAHEKLDQTEEAKKLYQEVINKYGAEPISEQARQRLAAL